MAHKDLKETWVLKESLDLLVSKGIQDLRVFLVHKALLAHLVKKDHKESQGLLVYQVQMGLRDTLEKKASLEKRGPWVLLVHKVLLAILVPVE